MRDKRFLGRFMGRDYVTIREEKHNGETIMAETSVGRMLLNRHRRGSCTRDGRYQIDGMAWGPKPIAAVEVKIDDGAWMKAKRRGQQIRVRMALMEPGLVADARRTHDHVAGDRHLGQHPAGDG